MFGEKQYSKKLTVGGKPGQASDMPYTPGTLTRTPEFRELRRIVRGTKSPQRKREEACEQRAQEHLAQAAIEPPGPKEVETHAMRRDNRSSCWQVAVPMENGRRRWLSTGAKDVATALKVVDASGIQRLSILARANCLTNDAISLVTTGQRVTCKLAIDRWSDDIAMDQAPKTAKIYRYAMTKVAEQADCLNEHMNKITRQQLYDFVNDETVKESTRVVRLAAIRSFYRYCAGYGYVIGNISTTVKINQRTLTVEQRERVPAVPFTEEEYRRIMASPLVSPFWHWATALGYWLGLRIVDVCHLEWASVGEDFAVLYPQKTGRKLILPLHDPLIGSGEIKAVFEDMRAKLTREGDYCFPLARRAHKLGLIENFDGGFKSMLALCGIEGKSFHGLRHSFKVRLFQSGKSIEEISRLMGHKSVAITEGYGRKSA